jgi:hypothetical protein
MATLEKQWAGGRSVLMVREIAPRVLYLKMSGFHDDVSVPKEFSAWFQRRTTDGVPVDMFWDTTDTTGYKSECRAELERWQKDARPRLASCTVLVRSRLMEMAIAVTNLLLGGMNKATRDREKFDGLIKLAIEKSRYGSSASAASPSA